MLIQLFKFYTIFTILLFASCSYSGPNGSGYDDPSALCRYVDVLQLSDYVKLDVPYEKQDFNYCGPASLSMILNYYDIDTDQHKVGDDIVTEYGVTPWDLKKVAISNGFSKTSIVSCGFNNLLDLLDRLSIPVLVRILSNTGKNGHYLVVTGYSIVDEQVFVNDPGDFKRTQISFDEFKELWDITKLNEDENSENLMIIVK